MSLASDLKIVASCPHCGRALRIATVEGRTVCQHCNNPLKKVFSAKRMAMTVTLLGLILLGGSFVISLISGNPMLNLIQIAGITLAAGAFSGFEYVKPSA